MTLYLLLQIFYHSFHYNISSFIAQNCKNSGSNHVTLSLFLIDMYTACGSMLAGSRGRFTTPHFPNGNSDHMDCEWIIGTTSGRTINLAFLSFDVGGRLRIFC